MILKLFFLELFYFPGCTLRAISPLYAYVLHVNLSVSPSQNVTSSLSFGRRAPYAHVSRDVPTVAYLNGCPVAVVPVDGASPYAAAAVRRRPERPTSYRPRDGRPAMTASVAAAASTEERARRVRVFRETLPVPAAAARGTATAT